MTQRMTFHIPVELKRRLRIAAAEEGGNMSQIAIRILEAWLDKRDAAKAKAAAK